MKTFYRSSLLSFVISLVLAPASRAGTHVWSGAGVNDLWSNPANWSSGGVPSAAEAHPVEFDFPYEVTYKTSTDNIPGIVVDVMTIHGAGYTFSGLNSATLTFSGKRGYNYISTSGGNATNKINPSLPVVLAATSRFLTEANQLLNIESVISGPGGLSAYGHLELAGAAANTYTGTTTAELSGTIDLLKSPGKNAFAGPLVIDQGVVSNGADNQIPDNVAITVRNGGIYAPYNHLETVGPITLDQGGLINVYYVNCLTLGGNVTVTGQGGTISKFLSLGGVTRTFDVAAGAVLSINADIIGIGGIEKTGAGDLHLNGSSTFSGDVTVSAGTCFAEQNTALGSTAGGTTVAAGATLILKGSSPLAVGNEILNLSGTVLYQSSVSWSGPMVLTGNASSLSGDGPVANPFVFSHSGVISGTGQLTKSGSGRLDLLGFAANTYSGGTVLNQGDVFLGKTGGDAIPGDVSIATAAVHLFAGEQINDNAAVTLADGSLDLGSRTETIGSLAGSNSKGEVKIALGSLITGQNNTSTEFDGLFSGFSMTSIVKTGSGVFRTNRSAGHTLTGNIFINAGTLQSDDATACSIIVNPLGVLKGTGSVSAITLHGGKVDPDGLTTGGLISDAPGSQLIIHINGSGPGQSSMMKVNGSLDLSGISLLVALNYLPYAGADFTLIDNDAADPPAGFFVGLSEGQPVPAGAQTFSITYHGGSGNDVGLHLTGGGLKLPVITQITVTPVPGSSPAQMAVSIQGSTEPGVSHQVQASTDLEIWTDIDPIMASDAQGVVSFSFNDGVHDRCFYRLIAR